MVCRRRQPITRQGETLPLTDPQKQQLREPQRGIPPEAHCPRNLSPPPGLSAHLRASRCEITLNSPRELKPENYPGSHRRAGRSKDLHHVLESAMSCGPHSSNPDGRQIWGSD